jgi:beta-1,4-mannooligosaccharide/beta-1,4-mannosyl-N-acetylglucosamine phosphorylase
MTLKRSQFNPILTRVDIPAVLPDVVDVSSVFNPGAIKVDSTYLLLLRVQTRGRETVLMLATSGDGERFAVRPECIAISGLERVAGRIYHLYDPRITSIDGNHYIMLAADTDEGCRLATVGTPDFSRFELIGFDSAGDTRNGVLFPQLFDGKYLRLERPNRSLLTGSSPSGSTITLSESADLQQWRDRGPVMSGRARYWDELIGAGAPPVKTRAGWLLVYHGIATHFASVNIYQAGVALLDLEDPSTVLARSRHNILEPREPYELTGQVPNVVFPSGMIVEDYDEQGFARPQSAVRLYYGAADTCVGLALTTVQELIDCCNKSQDLC